MLIRRDALAASGLWDPTLKGAEDRDLWLRLARSGARFLAVLDACVAYRRYDASTTANFETIFFSAKQVLAQHARHHGRCRDCRRASREGMRAMRQYCLDGNYWHTLRRHKASAGIRGSLGFILDTCRRDPGFILPLARHAALRLFSKLRPVRPVPPASSPIAGGAHP